MISNTVAVNVPAIMQIEAFRHLRACTKAAVDAAPPSTLCLAAQARVTEALRITHFAESMVSRCDIAAEKQYTIAKFLESARHE